jgi:hypothetical protein
MSRFRQPTRLELACTFGLALATVAAGVAAWTWHKSRRPAVALPPRPDVRPARFSAGEDVSFQPQLGGELWTGPWVRGRIVAVRLYSEPRDRRRLRYRYDIRSTEKVKGEVVTGFAVEEFDIAPAKR